MLDENVIWTIFVLLQTLPLVLRLCWLCI